MVQTTIKFNQKSLEDKIGKIEKLYGDTVEEKLLSYAYYAIEVSPVDTGAFVESMSIRPRGSRGGRSRSREARLRQGVKADTAQAKQEARAAVQGDAAQFKDQIIDTGGAVLINRAEDAKYVEREFQVFQRTRDRFRD